MKIINLLIAFVLALSMASCGHKNTTRSTDSLTTKVDSSSASVETTIVTERVDTMVILKPTESVSDVPFESIIDTSVLVIDNELQAVEVKFDPVTKRIRAKAKIKQREIPIVIDRTSVTTRAQISDYKSETKAKSAEYNKEIVKPLIPSYVWLMIIVLGIGALIMWFRQKITL
jgi:hypothetical protein